MCNYIYNWNFILIFLYLSLLLIRELYLALLHLIFQRIPRLRLKLFVRRHIEYLHQSPNHFLFKYNFNFIHLKLNIILWLNFIIRNIQWSIFIYNLNQVMLTVCMQIVPLYNLCSNLYMFSIFEEIKNKPINTQLQRQVRCTLWSHYLQIIIF